MATSPQRQQGIGRYDHRGARAPDNGVARPLPRQANRTAIAAVPDPMEPGARIVATVNRRVDVLENEHSHGRISHAAYEVGRIVQAVFERARGPGRTNWQGGSRVDAWVAHELAVIRGIEDARRIGDYLDRITRSVGPLDARLLRAVLGDRQAFAEVAAARGRAGERGTAYYGQRFRDALETLSDAWGARGRS